MPSNDDLHPSYQQHYGGARKMLAPAVPGEAEEEDPDRRLKAERWRCPKHGVIDGTCVIPDTEDVQVSATERHAVCVDVPRCGEKDGEEWCERPVEWLEGVPPGEAEERGALILQFERAVASVAVLEQVDLDTWRNGERGRDHAQRLAEQRAERDRLRALILAAPASPTGEAGDGSTVTLPVDLVRLLVGSAASYDRRVYMIEQYDELAPFLSDDDLRANASRPSAAPVGHEPDDRAASLSCGCADQDAHDEAYQETFSDHRCVCPDRYTDCPIHAPRGLPRDSNAAEHVAMRRAGALAVPDDRAPAPGEAREGERVRAAEVHIGDGSPIGDGEHLWTFTLRGDRYASGNTVRAFHEDGLVRGDSGEHAAVNVATLGGILWDTLDTDEPFTLEIAPDPAPAPSEEDSDA